MSQHYLHRGNIELAYEKRGTGPLVVLVQGLGMPGCMWLETPARLVEQGFCVVTPDTRGTGSSDVPWPPYAMRDLAEDLAAVLRDVSAEPALVVGMSLGGMIAQHLALRHPDLVGGLVLAATTCGAPLGKLPNLSFLSLVVRSLLQGDEVASDMRRVLVHAKSLERNPELFRQWEAQIEGVDVRWQGVIGQLSAASMHGTGFSLRKIRCPTEVIAGDDDRIIPSDNAPILAKRIPNAALTIVPDSGHVFPMEYPEALPGAVRRVSERMRPG